MDNINTTAIGRKQGQVSDALSNLENDSGFTKREKLMAMRAIHENLTERIEVLQQGVSEENEDYKRREKSRSKATGEPNE
jgi:hypothetical protein